MTCTAAEKGGSAYAGRNHPGRGLPLGGGGQDDRKLAPKGHDELGPFPPTMRKNQERAAPEKMTVLVVKLESESFAFLPALSFHPFPKSAGIRVQNGQRNRLRRLFHVGAV